MQFLARSVMAASFAAPLMSKICCRNVILHVYGLSSKQETAMLSLGMSIWGNPKKLIFSYKDGCDYLVKKAKLLRNLPLAIRGSDKNKDDRIIYVLSNETNHWKTTFLSTGKKPITYEGCSGSLRSRVIEIAPKGLWDYASIDYVVQALPICENNYGFAGPRFVEYVASRDVRAIRADHEKMQEAFEGNDKWNELAVLALADFYSGISVFREKNERKAWREAIELGREIMTASKR